MTDLDTCIKEYMAAQGGLLTAAGIQPGHVACVLSRRITGAVQ